MNHNRTLQDLNKQVEMPENGEEEIDGAWAYMFGQKVNLVMMARIPAYLMVPFLIGRLRSALSKLTFTDDDPDLALEWEKWFCILSIGLEGKGREEALGIAKAEMIEEEEADQKARLFGTMK